MFLSKHRLAFAVFALALAAPLHADPLADGIAAIGKGDYPAALRLLRPLADQGNAEAQLKLGLLHHYGLGVKENDALALQWLKKSAAQGNAEAQYQLGHMYTYGFVPKQEPDPDGQAAQWYFKAALQGHAEAQYNLGLMFLAGKGVEQNHAEAMKWIGRAAEGGHQPARSFLGGPPATK